MTQTANIGLELLAASQSQPHVPINFNSQALAALLPGVVEAIADSPESGLPDGSCWIVGAGENEFAGHDDEIAYIVDGAYHFVEPIQGWTFYVKALDAEYRYGGTGPGWEEVVSGGGGGGGGGAVIPVYSGEDPDPPSLTSSDPQRDYIVPMGGASGVWGGHEGERARWHPDTETWEYITDDPQGSVAIDLSGFLYWVNLGNWLPLQVQRNYTGYKVIASFGTNVPHQTNTPITWHGSPSGSQGRYLSWPGGTPTRLVAENVGLYQFNGGVAFDPGDIGPDDDVVLSLCKNGNYGNPIAQQSFRGANGTTVGVMAQVTGQVYLVADDYIELVVYHTAGGTIATSVPEATLFNFLFGDYLGRAA